MFRSPQRLWILAYAAAWLVAAASVHATTYYISISGNDSNAGTSPGSGAWLTTSKVNGRSFVAGDQILFEGGKTFGGGLGFGSDDVGNAANPIVVSSYGTGRATINAGSGTGITLYNTSGFSISELYLVGAWSANSQTGNSGNGVLLYQDRVGNVKLNYVRLNHIAIMGFKDNGMMLGAWPADGTKSGWADVQITDCEVHDNGDCGISSYGYFSGTATTYANSNIVVSGCTVYSNRGVQNTGANSGNGIVLGDVNGATIDRCLVYSNGDLNNAPYEGPVGIWTYDSNAVLMQRNESHSNRTGISSADGGGFDLDGGVTNSIIQYNYSHNNEGAGFLVHQYGDARPHLENNIVRYNISENDGRKGNYAGIWINGGSETQNNQLYHNTIFTSPAAGGGMPSAFANYGVGTGNTVRNNILQTSGGVLLINSLTTNPSNLLFQGNDYWPSGSAFAIKWGSTTYSSLATWRAATSQEKMGASNTGLEADPLLNNPGNGGTIGNPLLLSQLSAYKLRSNSSLINHGLDLLGLFGVSSGTRDFFGGTIPQGTTYDIGAHEFGLPTITSGPSASPNPAIYGSTYLTVSATDETGGDSLTYTWATTGSPPAPVSFSVNGTHAANDTTATFTKSGTYSLAVTVTNATGSSSSNSIQVIVNQTFEFWITEHSLTGDDALPNSDPYQIGIPNLLAYGLGIEPQLPDPQAGLPTSQLTSGNLILNYQAPHTDVIYQPEWSADLISWSTSGIDQATNGNARSASITVDTEPKKFIRLRIIH